ncbi:tetratricopeptide repeat protein [Phocaeicola coprophilus]|uniref:tetratricopeptide repeat protein n=1 Tax=Phocaeicola coprophilus TaxID=387090 RepID=UPI003AB3FD1E
MTEQHLQEWIKHPEHLNEESLQELKELVGRYPYFQTAWVLYLKNLFVLKDPSFQEELRRSAIYIADLSLLFYFIEGERFTIRKHAPQETRSGQGESDRTLDLIDRFLAELPEEPAQELPLPAEVSVDYTSILLDRMTEGDEEVAAVPLKGQHLIDRFIAKEAEAEVHPVDEELPEQPDELPAEPLAGQEKTEEPAEEPETVAASVSEPAGEGMGEEENPEEDPEESYFTETLAKIYVKQQRYDKALEIIRKLNLKYPKKNAYFADQIRFLEKLIINAKSK